MQKQAREQAREALRMTRQKEKRHPSSHVQGVKQEQQEPRGFARGSPRGGHPQHPRWEGPWPYAHGVAAALQRYQLRRQTFSNFL